MFYHLNPSVISEPSVAREKLAVWFVVVIGIAAGVEFLDYFCASLPHSLLVLTRFSCLLFFLSGGKVGESTGQIAPPPPPPLDPPLIMENFWV